MKLYSINDNIPDDMKEVESVSIQGSFVVVHKHLVDVVFNWEGREVVRIHYPNPTNKRKWWQFWRR